MPTESKNTRLVSLRLTRQADEMLHANLRKGSIKQRIVAICADEAALRSVDAVEAGKIEAKSCTGKTSANVPVADIERVQAIAKEKGVSFFALINQCLVEQPAWA